MDRRLPARVLALAALLGVSFAMYTVVTGGGDGSSGSAAGTATDAPSTERGTPASDEAERPRRSGRRRYTVRAGDTPSGIAEKTGVSVERLLDLNPDLDAQALQTGQRLRLR